MFELGNLTKVSVRRRRGGKDRIRIFAYRYERVGLGIAKLMWEYGIIFRKLAVKPSPLQ